jgi:hypothetical protein
LGLRWHETFSDILSDLQILPSKAEPDMWLQRNGNVYKYIGVYDDDLAIASAGPKSIIRTLETTYKLQSTGVGSITFHLGCNFNRDKDGTLLYGPKSYVEQMIVGYKKNLLKTPKNILLS